MVYSLGFMAGRFGAYRISQAVDGALLQKEPYSMTGGSDS